MPCAFSPACSKARPPARPSASSSRTPTSVRATTRRSRTASAPATRTTRTTRSTASATIAAAAAHPRAKPSMRVAAGAIARKYLAQRLGVNIYGYLSKIGSLTLEPVQPAFAYENPFFCPDPARVKELEDLDLEDSRRGRLHRRARHSCCGRGPARPGRARVRSPGCGHCVRHDGHQRGKSRGDRRRHACRGAEGQRAS